MAHRLWRESHAVPSDWQFLPLRQVIDHMDAGSSPLCDAQPAKAGEWGVLKVSAVSWDGFDDRENKALPSTLPPCLTEEVKVGDIVASRANTTELCGAVERVQALYTRLLLCDKTWRLHVREDADPDWLVAALKLPNTRRQIEAAATGTSDSMKNIAKRDFLNVRLPVPSQGEQRRIAAALKLADDAIQKVRAELQATRELKDALLNDLLEKGLPGRHSSYAQTKRFGYPKTWTLTKLKKCGSWSAGGTPDRENVGFYEGSIPWVKSGEVNYSVIVKTEEHLSEEGVQQTTCGLLPVGTLLIAMYGAGVTRGRVALLGVQASTNQAVATFNGHDGVENEFIYYWFERNYERVRAWAAGSNQDNLSGYLLKNIQIAIPDHGEQLEILMPLKAADTAIQSIQMRVEALMELKRSLLQNLLTGMIRIPEGAIHA